MVVVVFAVISFRSIPPKSSPARKGTPWLTKEQFLAYADGYLFQPPDASKPFRLRKEQIESLEINHDETDLPRVTFIVKTDEAKYSVAVFMMMHSSDGERFLTHFKPWGIAKQSTSDFPSPTRNAVDANDDHSDSGRAPR